MPQKLSVILSVFIIVCFPLTGKAAKPLPPIQVTIEPTQAGLQPVDIKPGDTVEFSVTARAHSDAQDMRIAIKILGGAVLVSGETSWSGPVAKNAEKSLILTVRAPQKGAGRIKARVEVVVAEGASFGAESEYTLGVEVKQKTAPSPKIKKDVKGRDVIEYRAQ